MLRTARQFAGIAAFLAVGALPASGSPSTPWSFPIAGHGQPTAGAFATDTVLYESAELHSLAALLQELGYRASPDRFESGRGYISSSSGGTRFVIVLYDCDEENGARANTCEDIHLSAWFGRSFEGTIQDANEWNMLKRHAKAVYDADDGTVGIQMDLTLKGGVTRAYLEEYLQLWERYLATFRQFLSNAH